MQTKQSPPPDETFVYESEPDESGQCSRFEEYDDATQLCTFTCTGQSECDDIMANIETEMQSLADTKPKVGTDEKPITSDSPSKEVEYAVGNGESITLRTGTKGQNDAKIWKQIQDLSPDTFTTRFIDTFQIFNAPDDDTLAFVDDADGDGKFRIGVNRPQHESSTKEEQIKTLIHELGHILTLNQTQSSTEVSACEVYKTDEGCFAQSSILGRFVSQFWKPDQRKRAAAGEAVYREGDFVTEYAASSPEEDVAESFAYFVTLSDLSKLPPKQKEKTTHFTQFDDAVAMRKSMRQTIAAGIVRARKIAP
jgi:hypothetical protein